MILTAAAPCAAALRLDRAIGKSTPNRTLSRARAVRSVTARLAAFPPKPRLGKGFVYAPNGSIGSLRRAATRSGYRASGGWYIPHIWRTVTVDQVCAGRT